MASPNDLTTLADCKAWLGVTTTADDGLLAALITALSRAILADLGRPGLLPTTWSETLAAGAAPVLRHWPVTRLLACAVGEVSMAGAIAQGRLAVEAADPAPPGAPQALLVRPGVLPRGALTVSYRAGYEVTGEPATVPGAAPFTLSVQAPYGSWRVDTGVAGAAAPYAVVEGTYTFAPADAGAAVTLSYGYVPADLARAACEWVADRYSTRTRIGQTARTLGGQETASFLVKAMPDIVDRLLQPYRRVAR